ncbi:MAG: glycoside hydrolase 43 family protein [Muribaculaceae bacterium]|nr:glycoside hydrolase 43 family protein [Muribaculaceae bacterium]
MITKLKYIIAMLTVSAVADTAGAAVSKTWCPDNGDGTYTNPIIHADYSDPDVIRVGDDFYMTASSFQCVPGLPILHSRDLVNWDIVNYALDKLEPAEFYAVPRHGKGVWAPSIRFHNDTYYIYWGDPDFGIFMVSAADPLGKWSDPVLVKGGKGMIDPTPLWDEDGRAYLVNGWAGSRAGFNSVLTVWEMSPDGTALIGNPVIVFDGNDGVNHTVEGPKFYKRDGFYYILCPAGGVEQGWQLALRSRSPFGPYESKIVMAQGDTDINGPHQGGLVDTADGESWFINFQDKGLYGRVLHLNPVTWVDGWPIMGDNGKPVSRHAKPRVSAASERINPPESDTFDGIGLGRQWEWHANYQPAFGMTSSGGFVRVYGHYREERDPNMWSVPNLLLQKFTAPSFTATAHVTVSAKAHGNSSGLIVMGHDYARLSVVKTEGDDFILTLVTCKDAEQGGDEIVTEVARIPASRVYEAGLHPNYELNIWLRVKVADGGKCTFSYSLDGLKYKNVSGDFQARQGKWIGAKVGVFSITPVGTDRGWIDVDSFDVCK